MATAIEESGEQIRSCNGLGPFCNRPSYGIELSAEKRNQKQPRIHADERGFLLGLLCATVTEKSPHLIVSLALSRF
jgi:hypothetical protein